MKRYSLLALAYVGFVSLGLPDGLLGAAWPPMRREFGLPLDAAGAAILLGTAGGIVSSIASARVLARIGTGGVVAGSALLASLALLATSMAPAWPFVLAATVCAGLAGGGVDAALNLFVARRFLGRHMSWLHACWGLGAATGPLLIGALLDQGAGWRGAYGIIGAAMLGLAGVFFLTRASWAEQPPEPSGPASGDGPQGQAARRPGAGSATGGDEVTKGSAIGGARGQAARRPETGGATGDGAKTKGLEATASSRSASSESDRLPAAGVASCALFALYTGLESSAGLWGASYLVEVHRLSPAAAGVATSIYWGSLTAGRFLLGPIVDLLGPKRLLALAGSVAAAAAALLALSGASSAVAIAALAALGFALAPIYPTLMHETPRLFGARLAASLVGYQVAAGALGIMSLPWAVGWLGRQLSLSVLPPSLLALALAMIGLERLRRRWAAAVAPD